MIYMYDNIYEEERDFPYLNLSLEKSRLLRYLVSNFYALKDDKLIRMYLERQENKLFGNGLIYGVDNNKSFYTEIEYVDGGVNFYTEIEEIYGKRFYSIDMFRFKENDIEVISNIEGKDTVRRKIPYNEGILGRK